MSNKEVARKNLEAAQAAYAQAQEEMRQAEAAITIVFGVAIERRLVDKHSTFQKCETAVFNMRELATELGVKPVEVLPQGYDDITVFFADERSAVKFAGMLMVNYEKASDAYCQTYSCSYNCVVDPYEITRDDKGDITELLQVGNLYFGI